MSRNILILTTPFRPNVGGVETHLDDLISVGVKQGYFFYILTYQPLVTKVFGQTIEKRKGFTIYRIPWIRMNLFLILNKFPIFEFLYLFPGLFLLGLLFLLFNNSKVNIIHAQGLVAGTIGIFLGKIFNKKVILSTHSIYNFPKSGMYHEFSKFLLNSCEKVLCLSYQSEQEVIRLGVDKSKVEVFTYWVNHSIFHAGSKLNSRKKLHLDKDAFICLFVGRLVTGKGIPELLESTRLLKNQIKFIIVGDGPLSELVREACKKQPNLKFEGKISNSNLPIYYNAADILLVPSTHEEGYGRVILEALSCGLPIVATNKGGIKEYINQKVGTLINITPSKIKNSILFLMNNPNKLESMRVEAAKYAKIHFREANCQTIFKNYE